MERAVDQIVLNSKMLDITTAKLVNDSKSTVLLPAIHVHQEEEILILQFSEKIAVGKAQVRIEFNGELTAGCIGLYRFKQAA